MNQPKCLSRVKCVWHGLHRLDSIDSIDSINSINSIDGSSDRNEFEAQGGRSVSVFPCRCRERMKHIAGLRYIWRHCHPPKRKLKLNLSSAVMSWTVPINSRNIVQWFRPTVLSRDLDAFFALRHVDCRSSLLTYLLTYVLKSAIFMLIIPVGKFAESQFTSSHFAGPCTERRLL